MKTSRLPLCAALVIAILLVLPSPALPRGASSPTSAAPSEGAGETLVATVCSCDPEAKTINLLTGCGHALWMVKVSVGSEATLAQKGKALSLSELKPGAVVRARYRKSEDRNVAQSVELQAPGGEK